MSLRDLANETLSNFNPATDSANSMDNIPAGEYDVYVDKAGYRAYDSGYDCVNIMAKVATGDHMDRVEGININVDPDNKTNVDYPFLMKRNIKLISQLAYACGIELEDEDWEDQMSLGDRFARDAMGAQFVLNITETKNKKDPSNPYRNYEFVKYADDSEGAY